MQANEDFDVVDVTAVITAGMNLLSICESGNVTECKRLIEEEDAPVWFQEPETGWSPLHIAAHLESREMIEYLLAHGAVWNAVDHLGNTAGDVSLSLNDEECYGLIRAAGLRSEFLLRLIGNRAEAESAAVLKVEAAPAVSSDVFLSTKLRYTTDENGQEICLVDAGDGEDVGVMMGWERPIMQKTVERLCEGQTDEIYVLNVGFGLGIIDGLFQSLHSPPKKHVIIEAHPDVLAHMRSTGWYDKPGVEILEGKWQDFISSPQLLEYGGFDVVYTDTFSEEYDDLHRFFETVPDLLRGPQSRFGWFNGLGATNALFYDVYSRLAEIHIQDIGMNISWSDVEVHGEEEEIWSGTRKYFSLPYYRLPVCEMKP